MNVTDYLIEKSNGLLHIQQEVSDNAGRYSMFDDGATEVEVGEFLYGLVRLVKPERVLTTGVYTGVSDMYIAQALKDNGFGKSTALEFEQFHIDRAVTIWEATGVRNQIDVLKTSSLAFQPEGTYQLMFLDTEPQIRFAELEKFYPFLASGGYIGIHDLPRSMCQGNINPDHPDMKSYPFGDIPENMQNWMKDGELVKWHFPSPRGMVFFYKPQGDDYHCK